MAQSAPIKVYETSFGSHDARDLPQAIADGLLNVTWRKNGMPDRRHKTFSFWLKFEHWACGKAFDAAIAHAGLTRAEMRDLLASMPVRA